MLHGKPFADIGEVVKQCLNRDPGWVSASRDAVDGLQYPTSGARLAYCRAQREVFRLAQLGRYRTRTTRCGRWSRPPVATTCDTAVGSSSVPSATFISPILPPRYRSKCPRNRVITHYSGHGTVLSTDDSAVLVTKRAKRLSSSPGGTQVVISLGVAAILNDLHPNPDQAAITGFEQATLDLG